MSSARKVATDFTLCFLENYISKPQRILEVGCGSGDLSHALKERGHDILGIDTSEKAIINTKAKGVSAKLARIEDIKDDNFDAILFTRSLHHIHPIESCLEVARLRLKLKPSGQIILEDFGYDLFDEKTALWHGVTLDDWFKDHNHGPQLHKFKDLVALVKSKFKNVQVIENIPYLFRYSINSEKATEESILELLEIEKSLINKNKISGIGFRLVAGH